MIKYRASKYDDSFLIARVETSEDFKNCFLGSMETLIRYFNYEYKWDDMFTTNDVIERLDNGHILFILFHKSNPLGYTFFREIDSTTTFLYNFYVTKVLDRSKELPIKFTNIVCKEMFEKYDYIELECEEWNTAAQKVFESNYFKKIND